MTQLAFSGGENCVGNRFAERYAEVCKLKQLISYFIHFLLYFFFNLIIQKIIQIVRVTSLRILCIKLLNLIF